MASPIVYRHFAGALYPLDLTAESPSDLDLNGSLKSLVQICASHIVQDSTKTQQATQFIPHELFIPLMQAAILENKDRAIAVLLSSWPFKSLSLRTLVPNLYKSARPLFDRDFSSDIARKSLSYTTCIAHAFIENLKKDTSKLKCIDITGFPTAEVIITYLASYTMLAHNEMRQSITMNMYNDAISAIQKLCSTPEYQLLQPDSDMSFPNEAYAVKVDACIASEQSYSELCRALKVSGFDGIPFRIVLDKIDATCIGQAGMSLLLKLVTPELVSGLRLKYNSLSCEDFVKLGPDIRNLTNLTALDLSCNAIHLYKDDRACDLMGEVLSHLTKLQRLDLSSNLIKTRLRRLLQNMTNPLKYLRLCACGLTCTDIAYLSVSHHAQCLQELDLSENRLSSCVRQLCTLFENARSTLLTLSMESCKFTSEQIVTISHALPSLHSLLYLNIANSFLSLDTLKHFVGVYARLDNSKALEISYPLECYMLETDSADEISRCKLQAVIDLNKAALLNRHMGRRKLELCVTELSEMH